MAILRTFFVQQLRWPTSPFSTIFAELGQYVLKWALWYQSYHSELNLNVRFYYYSLLLISQDLYLVFMPRTLCNITRKWWNLQFKINCDRFLKSFW